MIASIIVIRTVAATTVDSH